MIAPQVAQIDKAAIHKMEEGGKIAHRETIAKVDLIDDPNMVLVGSAEFGSGHPLVAGKHGSWLQHPEDFAVHFLQLHAEIVWVMALMLHGEVWMPVWMEDSSLKEGLRLTR